MKTLIVVLVVFGIGVALALVSRAGRTTSAAARQLVADGALLLDVRTRGEFAQGHLSDALNIPVQELRARLSELSDKDRPIVVYCASGVRSARARRLLSSAGHGAVYDLGPMSAW